MPLKFDAALDAVLDADARYPRAAYHFLRDVLESIQCPPDFRGRRGVHVAAGELMDALRNEGIGQFGPMAIAVMEEWGIRSWEDWGNMVFRLRSHGIIECRPEDRLEDFRGRMDFAEAFSGPCASQGVSARRRQEAVRARRQVPDSPAPVA